jgi:hypothetical protein
MRLDHGACGARGSHPGPEPDQRGGDALRPPAGRGQLLLSRPARRPALCGTPPGAVRQCRRVRQLSSCHRAGWIGHGRGRGSVPGLRVRPYRPQRAGVRADRATGRRPCPGHLPHHRRPDADRGAVVACQGRVQPVLAGPAADRDRQPGDQRAGAHIRWRLAGSRPYQLQLLAGRCRPGCGPVQRPCHRHRRPPGQRERDHPVPGNHPADGRVDVRRGRPEHTACHRAPAEITPDQPSARLAAHSRHELIAATGTAGAPGSAPSC